MITHQNDHIVGDPAVARVWRRQTFSAAIESCTPEMAIGILYEQVPQLTQSLDGALPVSGGVSILESAYEFSRMLHSSNSSAGDAFYRAFVPELGSTLYPRQIELVKRCMLNERGELDRVGTTIFPGLVKISRGPALPGGDYGDNVQVFPTKTSLESRLKENHNFLDYCKTSPSDLPMRNGSVICTTTEWPGDTGGLAQPAAFDVILLESKPPGHTS